MKVLYLNSGATGASTVTAQQLARVAPQLQIGSVGSLDEAVAEIRKGGWLGLLTSPAMGEADTLALVTKLRHDRMPIAIVPVVVEWRQEFFSSAVAAGADDVLLVRGETAVHASETLLRIKQSPHLVPAEERRLRVLYVGKDTLVWHLLEQVPFVKAERATSLADGAIAGREVTPGADPLRTDTIVVDDAPGEGPSLPVVKFVRGAAPDLPIVVLASATAGESAAGVLDLGVDDCIPKTGIYRRRLIATLNRVHQRHELSVQHLAIKGREARLRQIVENMPQALAIISGDGTVLAMNTTALPLFGATRPADIVGRNVSTLIKAEQRDETREFLERVIGGQASSLAVELEPLDQVRRHVQIDGVVLERDARGARGVIALVRPPRPATGPDAEAMQARVAAATAEAAERVHTATTQLQRAAETHRAERSAWDTARVQLEHKLQELTAEVETRKTRDTRVASTEAELRDANAAKQQLELELEAVRTELLTSLESREQLAADIDSIRAELRDALEGRANERTAAREAAEKARLELEIARGDADVARADSNRVRDRLAAVTQDLEQARDGRTREQDERLTQTRAESDALRAELDGMRAERDHARSERDHARSELDQVRTERDHARSEIDNIRVDRDHGQSALDGAHADRDHARTERDRLATDLEAARQAQQRLADEHLADRAGWEASRFQFETRLSEMQSSAIARVEVEARLEAARADLRQVNDTFSAERAGWEATRRQLETRLHETQAAAGDRGELEASLDAARVELRYLGETSARDRALAENTRKTLDRQLQDARDAHQSERDAWTKTREEMQRQISTAGGAEHERVRLAASLRALEAEHAAYVEAQSVDRATRQRERTELDGLRAQLDEERARRIQLDDEVAAVRAEGDARAAALEIEFAAGRRALEARLDDADSRAAAISADGHTATRRLESKMTALAESRGRLETSPLFGYALTTVDGRLVRCNDTFARLFGYRDGRDAVARNAGGPFPPMASRDALDARLLADRALPRFESCLERLDGTTITLSESATIVPAPEGLATGADAELVERVLVDTSGPAALEDRLRQARRIEEVGTLATAMAPDIGKLLASIDEMGAQLAAELDGHHAQQARAERIRARASHAIDLVRQLLAFSRRQVQSPSPIDLNEAIGRAEPMLNRLIGAHVHFEIDLGRAEGVAANLDDLDQLLTTLVVSGRDLLPVGGSLVLATKRSDFDHTVEDADNRPGPGVVLSITAAGYGVQAVQQAQAVEVVARRCGGELRMSGEPGRRAVLEVLFSRCALMPVRAVTKGDGHGQDVTVDYWSGTPD
jgi:PAS domain S-box-containing protein